MIAQHLASFYQFSQFGTSSHVDSVDGVPRITNEFWTSRQRAAHPLHEISYRACFKPQLPRFFIERLTAPGDLVYDPFLGRGTSVLEAAFLGRRVGGSDVNPLARYLIQPRLQPPTLQEVEERLKQIGEFKADSTSPCCPSDDPQMIDDLLAFYHPETLSQLQHLREYLHSKESDHIDRWIAMVALNRLAGHSAGFFSVYTLPPNQAVSAESQRRINTKLKQVPEPKCVSSLILKKSKSLLSGLTEDERRRLWEAATDSRLFTQKSQEPVALPSNKVSLVVTSPPFLDVVDYQLDNWLRCWFVGLDSKQLCIDQSNNAQDWQLMIEKVFKQLKRIVKPSGHIAFEVGEVRNGKIRLEDLVIPAARNVGLTPWSVLINQQDFTKTANCWGVSNGTRGTNTNRIVLLQNQG